MTKDRDEVLRTQAIKTASNHLRDTGSVTSALRALTECEDFITRLNSEHPPTLNPSEALMRSLLCERCGAGYGQPCKTISGKVCGTSHSTRFYDAHDAGLIGMAS